MPTQVLPVTPDMAHLLGSVAEDVFDAPIVPDRLADYLADPTRLLVVALEGQTVVGQCAASLMRHVDKADELYIDNLGVTPSSQRQGLGQRLVAAALAWGRERGCGIAWVLTEPDNAPARGLYASAGGVASNATMYELEL